MANNKRDEIGSDPSEGTSHPVGKTVGALAGAAAGAAATSVAGPIGTVAGAAIGGIAGWLEGKTIAEGINPDEEIAYWRSNYNTRPYYEKGSAWDDYEPAYSYGVRAFDRNRDYDSVESDLERGWEKTKGKSRLGWEKARHSVKDAWLRLTTEH